MSGARAAAASVARGAPSADAAAAQPTLSAEASKFYQQLDEMGGVYTVMVPGRQYDDALQQTRRRGHFDMDFDDEDGVCTTFLRGEHLYLRTARGEVKGLQSLDETYALARSQAGAAPAIQATALSPRGRFSDYCHAAGVASHTYMDFLKLLNNDALLDNVLVHIPDADSGPGFVYVAKDAAAVARGGVAAFYTTSPAVWAHLVRCADAHHAVLLALVRRKDVDVGQLVKQLRRSKRTADTVRLLSAPDVADAHLVVLRQASPCEAAAMLAQERAPRAAEPEPAPRERFLRYADAHGLPAADAAAFADALVDDGVADRINLVALDKSRGTQQDPAGTRVVVLHRVAAPPEENMRWLTRTQERMPARLWAATTVALFHTDVNELAARLRAADPCRVLPLVSSAPGYIGVAVTDQEARLKASVNAPACAVCGARDGAAGPDASTKLRACGGCGLVLYCGTECQHRHWRQHKPACRAKAAKKTKA